MHQYQDIKRCAGRIIFLIAKHLSYLINYFLFQNLLPLLPVIFQPELLLANDNGTLVVVAGPNGILVMELPTRYPPYGAFENNKDVVYCR